MTKTLPVNGHKVSLIAMDLKEERVQQTVPRGARGLVGEPEARFPLGPLENFMRITHDEFDGDGTVAVVARVRGRFEEEPLLQVLSMLQRRHPKMRARITADGQGGARFEVFESLREIPLIVKDYETDDLPWQREVTESCTVKFSSPTEPLWRVEVLRSKLHSVSDLICAIHHACGDGVTAFLFLKEFFTLYAFLMGEADDFPSHMVEPLPFLSSSRVPTTTPLIRKLMIAERLIRGQIQKRRGAWSALPQDPGRPPSWSRHVLSAEETHTLAQRCRQEQTTPYGALFAAVQSG